MALNIVSLVMQFITPDMIARMAHTLGLDRTLTQKAVIAMIPAILGGMAAKASKPDGARQVSDVLAKQDPGLLGQLGGLLGGQHHAALVEHGTSMVGGLLGDAAVGNLTGAVSRYAGIGEPATRNLMGVVAPVVTGAVAQYQLANRLDAGGLASMLAEQKGNIASAVPGNFASMFDGAGLMASIIDKGGAGGAADGVVDAARNVAGHVGGLIKGATAAGAAIGALETARNVAGTIGGAVGTVTGGVGAAANAVGQAVTPSGAVDAARNVAGTIGGVTGAVASGATAVAGKVGQAVTPSGAVETGRGAVGRLKRYWQRRGARATASVADGASTVGDRVGGAIGTASSGTVDKSRLTVTHGAPDTGRNVAARVGGASQNVEPAAKTATHAAPRPAEMQAGNAARTVGGSVSATTSAVARGAGAVETAGLASGGLTRWAAAIPIALLLLGGVGWWWWSSAERTRIAVVAEKTRIESAEKLAVETRARQRAEADVAAAKLAAETEARARAEAQAAAAKRVADAEARAKADAEAAAVRLAAEARARQDAESDANATRLAAETRAKSDAEAAAARLAAETRARQQAEADATAARLLAAETEARAKADAQATAARQAAEADARAKANAEAAATRLAAETQMRQKAEADATAARLAAEADARAKAEADAARLASETQTRQRAEADAAAARQAAEARAKADAEAAAARLAAETRARQQAESDANAARLAADARAKAELQACQNTVSAAAAERIQFKFASASIESASYPTLDRLATAIKSCPSMRVRVEGHTDADGDINRNQRLSENRAKSVMEYLVKAGIDANSVSSAGFGQMRPLAANDSDENKGRNRRIEFVVDRP